MNRKPQSLVKGLLLIVSVLLVPMIIIGCKAKYSNTETTDYVVIIENQSDTDFYEIAYTLGSQNLESGGGINADESAITKGDLFPLYFKTSPGTLNLTLLDDEKNVLLSETMNLSFQEKKITLVLTDDRGELILTPEEPS